MTPVQSFTGVRACVFDAYGTLFDFASAAAKCVDALGGKAGPFTALWRDKQLQYTWLRTLQSRYADFWQVTGDALDFALDAFAVSDPELRRRLMEAYRELAAFPEVPVALQALKERGFRTAILSNGAPAMLETAVTSASIGPLLDHVVSVDEIRRFKPDPAVYQLAVERLGTPAAAILFVSSNGWDAWAAAEFGMRVVWCNRQKQPRERLPGAPDREVGSLAELPLLLPAAPG